MLVMLLEGVISSVAATVREVKRRMASGLVSLSGLGTVLPMSLFVIKVTFALATFLFDKATLLLPSFLIMTYFF
jgi:hypothetical protein